MTTPSDTLARLYDEIEALVAGIPETTKTAEDIVEAMMIGLSLFPAVPEVLRRLYFSKIAALAIKGVTTSPAVLGTAPEDEKPLGVQE